MSIELQAVCDGKQKVATPGGGQGHNVHFTIVDTPENRQHFGGGPARGEVQLIGLAEDAYTYDEHHTITLGSNSERPAPQRPAPNRTVPGQAPPR